MNENLPPFKYKNAILTFEWGTEIQTTATQSTAETLIKITWQYVVRRTGDIETHSYNRTTAQLEAFYLPLLRIILGLDSISNALLYVNDEHSKAVYGRLLEQGTDFFTIKGIKIKEDGTWQIE